MEERSRASQQTAGETHINFFFCSFIFLFLFFIVQGTHKNKIQFFFFFFETHSRVTALLTPPCRLGSRGMYGERLSWSDADGRLLWGEDYATFVRQGCVLLFEIVDVVPKGPSLTELKAGNGP